MYPDWSAMLQTAAGRSNNPGCRIVFPGMHTCACVCLMAAFGVYIILWLFPYLGGFFLHVAPILSPFLDLLLVSIGQVSGGLALSHIYLHIQKKHPNNFKPTSQRLCVNNSQVRLHTILLLQKGRTSLKRAVQAQQTLRG